MTEPCEDALRILGHELRRPLTVIRGASTLLMDDGDALPPESRQNMLSMIDRSATEMSDLIDDLMIAVHLDIGDVDYSFEAVDLPALVRDAVEWARRGHPDRCVRVGPMEDLEVEADRDHALRALRALVVNALQFSPEDSPVEVAAGAAGGVATLDVLDRGPGIPAAQRERVFDKFARLDPRVGGAGLGLFLARGLARGMGGDVAVGDREDGGAAICFTLRRRG